MKIAVSSTGKDFNAQIDLRFGRCDYFLIIDIEHMQFVAYENEHNMLGNGAGIEAAGFIVSKGVKTVLTGNCGPKAMSVFNTAGVTVMLIEQMTVKEAVQRFKASSITTSNQPIEFPNSTGTSRPVASFSYGRGIGRCRGGSGRGMGGGRGMGCGLGGGKGIDPQDRKGNKS